MEIHKPPGHFLFLDFDGVLHPNGDRYDNPFCFMNNFCAALRMADPMGRIGMVISSTWRHAESLAQLKAHFPPDVAARILGVTPLLGEPDPSSKGVRQQEIVEWMEHHAPAGKWLAVDDRRHYFDEGCPHLFLVPNNDPDYERDSSQMLSLMDAVERREMLLRKWRIESLGINADVMHLLQDRLREFLAA